MSIVTKLIGMVALRQTALETRIAVQNFLTSTVSGLVLALASGLMIGALLIGIHILIYQALVSFTELTTIGSIAVTLGIGIVITSGFVIAAIQQFKHAFNLPKPLQVEPCKQPVGTRIAGIAEAFFDGLTGRSTSSRY